MSSERQQKAERLKELLENSQAWLRLQEPATEHADQEFRIMKSDVASVFQAIIFATFILQHSVLELEEHAMKTDTTFEEFKSDLDKRHQEFLNSLFDPNDGAFTRLREYIDNKHGKIASLLIGLLVSVTTALIVFEITSVFTSR